MLNARKGQLSTNDVAIKHRPLDPARGARIAERRRQLGWHTQMELARRVGHTSQSLVSNWENGAAIGAVNLVKLGEVLDVSTDWILTGRDEASAPMSAHVPRGTSHMTRPTPEEARGAGAFAKDMADLYRLKRAAGAPYAELAGIRDRMFSRLFAAMRPAMSEAGFTDAEIASDVNAIVDARLVDPDELPDAEVSNGHEH